MKNMAAMLLLAIMWGLSIPVTKIGLQSLPPLTLTALRFAAAVPLLLPFFVGKHRIPWRELPRVAALGVLGIGIGQVAQAYGVAGTSASVGTIISATIPVFVVIFAAVRLKQPVSGLQRFGLLAAFIGIGLVALDGDATGGLRASAGGVAWMLLSAVTIAFYYVWGAELAREHGIVPLAAWSTLFGFLAVLPWTAWEVRHTPFQITGEGLAAAGYLGAVVTVAGLLLWLHLLRTVPARIAASVQFLQPVIGVAASSAIFGDQLGLLFGIGVALVLAGLALTTVPRTRTPAT